MLKTSVIMLLAVALATPCLVRAQGSEAPPKPPGAPFGKGEGEHKGRFGPGPGGMRMPNGMNGMSGFEKLSEDERKRVREAMEKAWKKPEIEAARDKVMKANEEFRDALRTTLQGIDPEVVKILEKIKPQMPWEMRGPPPSLRPEDPEFVKHAIAKLGFETISFGKPEQREALRRLHDRVLALPSVREAITKLEAAPVGERLEAFKGVREAYRKEFEKQISEYRKNHQPPASKTEEKKL